MVNGQWLMVNGQWLMGGRFIPFSVMLNAVKHLATQLVEILRYRSDYT